MREVLEGQSNLQVKQAEVAELLIEELVPGDAERGESSGTHARLPRHPLRDGRVVSASAVVVTTGTFLNGLIHCGEQQYPAGRSGEPASVLLGELIKSLGLRGCRFKTGTPPRLDGRTIDWSRFVAQPGDADPTPFSFRTERQDQGRSRRCRATSLTPRRRRTASSVRTCTARQCTAARSHGIGPRYCPSIEDKIVQDFRTRTSTSSFWSRRASRLTRSTSTA